MWENYFLVMVGIPLSQSALCVVYLGSSDLCICFNSDPCWRYCSCTIAPHITDVPLCCSLFSQLQAIHQVWEMSIVIYSLIVQVCVVGWVGEEDREGVGDGRGCCPCPRVRFNLWKGFSIVSSLSPGTFFFYPLCVHETLALWWTRKCTQMTINDEWFCKHSPENSNTYFCANHHVSTGFSTQISSLFINSTYFLHTIWDLECWLLLHAHPTHLSSNAYPHHNSHWLCHSPFPTDFDHCYIHLHWIACS